MTGVQPTADERPMATPPRGFWGEAWARYRRMPLAMAGLVFVGLMATVALLAPVIAGTKPVVCRYKGRIYFPCLAYYNRSLEPVVFSS